MPWQRYPLEVITVTEQKIAGFTPRWAPFPGFSLLFDNGGKSLTRNGDFETIACDVQDDPEIPFYRKLHEGLAALNPDRLLQSYFFCALPCASYHVTAYDVANIGDLNRCHSDIRDDLRNLCGGLLEGHWPDAHPILSPALETELTSQTWDLRFRYHSLSSFGGNGLFVKLCPADDESQRSLDRFTEVRRKLSQTYRERFSVGAGERFTPHTSIGYFANRESAELASARLAAWDELLRENTRETVLTFSTVSLYAFRSMETFFRKAR